MISEYSFPPGVLPYKSDGGALCILGGLNLWIGTA